VKGGEHILGGHLTLRIVTPETAAYDGAADLVVVPGHDGEVAFLPGHAPYVGVLGAGELRFHDAEGGTHHYFLEGGVVQVADDVVNVLAEVVRPAEALDPVKAEAELESVLAAPAKDPAVREKATAAARAKVRVARKAGTGAHGKGGTGAHT
jgi:F-type H+-transporting ATPase subunit epsilon